MTLVERSRRTSSHCGVANGNVRVTCAKSRRNRNFTRPADWTGPMSVVHGPHSEATPLVVHEMCPVSTDQAGPIVLDRVVPGSAGPRRDKRRARQETVIQKALEQWGTDFLMIRQAKDADIAHIKAWLAADIRPSWNDVRGLSPVTKVYY